jgi:peptide/nickel transport system permease protein
VLGKRALRSSDGADDAAAARASSRGTWHRLRARRTFWLGATGIALLFLASAGGPLVWSLDPLFMFRDAGLTDVGQPVGPTEQFPLGTDLLGRDYLSRLLHGGRVSLGVGVGASLLATAIGVLVGGVAAVAGNPPLRVALRGGRTVTLGIPLESILMRLTDAVLAFPILLLAIALVAIIGPSMLLVTAIIAGFLWTSVARIVYGRVRTLLQREFIEAARALGVSDARILLRHVLPHAAPLVVAYGTLGISTAILLEASLSYIGVGLPLPAPSWGSMIAQHASYYASDPRLLALPGGAVMLTILSFNLVGDALRDALDPHLIRA